MSVKHDKALAAVALAVKRRDDAKLAVIQAVRDAYAKDVAVVRIAAVLGMSRGRTYAFLDRKAISA